MSEERTVGQKLKRGFESKVLVPLAVTVVSAATSYLAKKLPLLLEEKVLPKLREQAGAAGVRDSVVEAAETVKEKAVEVVPSLGAEADGSTASSNGEQPTDDREEERRKREERRQERKRALQGV